MTRSMNHPGSLGKIVCVPVVGRCIHDLNVRYKDSQSSQHGSMIVCVDRSCILNNTHNKCVVSPTLLDTQCIKGVLARRRHGHERFNVAAHAHLQLPPKKRIAIIDYALNRFWQRRRDLNVSQRIDRNCDNDGSAVYLVACTSRDCHRGAVIRNTFNGSRNSKLGLGLIQDCVRKSLCTTLDRPCARGLQGSFIASKVDRCGLQHLCRAMLSWGVY